MTNLNKPICLLTAFLGLSVAAKAIDENKLTDHFIRSLYIPELHVSPVIDGNLEKNVWDDAAALPAFVRTAGDRTGEEAEYSTECYAFRNGNKLFIAFVCHDPDIRNLRANITEWDNPDIIYDDRVEIFLDTDHDHRDYFEMAVNSKGIQFDQKLFLRYPKTRTNENDPGWNCNWKVRTHILADRWTAEIEIDVNTLGIPNTEDGMTWGFNAARARRPEINKGRLWRVLSNETEYSAWCRTDDGIWETLSNFQEPFDFGDLTFGNHILDIQNIRFKDAGFTFGGTCIPPSNVGLNPLEIQFGSTVPKESGYVLGLTTSSQKGKKWSSKQKIETDESNTFHTSYFIQENEESRLDIEIRDKKTNSLIYKTAYVLTVPPFIDFDLNPLYLRKRQDSNPVSCLLNVDQPTLNRSALAIELYDKANNLITKKLISSPQKTQDYQHVFNADSLRALDGGNYYFKSILMDKSTSEMISSFIQPFTKPELHAANDFQLIEGPYRYAGMTGNATQINFPNGQRYVFWENAGNAPFWDVDQVGLCYEFVESNGFTTQGCTEAMQDRQCRYSSVEVTENTPARIVVHWRYALTDAHYRIHHNEWVDEYYRFYPDGVGVREVNLWANGNEIHEYFEIIPVNPPAMQEKDMFDGYVARLSNLSGQSLTTEDFNRQDQKFHDDFFKSSEDFLIEINLKDRMHPFSVFSYRDSICPGVSDKTITLCNPKEYSLASHRGHWPASQFAIDGYNLIGNHRPSHGNIGSIKSEVDSLKNPNRFTVLLGIVPEGSDDGQEHGYSWLNPGRIICKTSSVSFQKYDMNQRAYLLNISGYHKEICLTMKPLNNAVKNPVFILNGIRSEELKTVSLNGKTLGKNEFKTGNNQSGECILFINRTITKDQHISLKF